MRKPTEPSNDLAMSYGKIEMLGILKLGKELYGENLVDEIFRMLKRKVEEGASVSGNVKVGCRIQGEPRLANRQTVGRECQGRAAIDVARDLVENNDHCQPAGRCITPIWRNGRRQREMRLTKSTIALQIHLRSRLEPVPRTQFVEPKCENLIRRTYLARIRHDCHSLAP